MARRTYADASREPWGDDETSTPRADLLMLGVGQRIADAVEKMADPYVRLLERVGYLERRVNESVEYANKLRRRIVALRGVVTRTKRRADRG